MNISTAQEEEENYKEKRDIRFVCLFCSELHSKLSKRFLGEFYSLTPYSLKEA